MQAIAIYVDKKGEAEKIIHGYASAHALVALTLANTIVGDAPVLTVLTFAMIDALGGLFGVKSTPFVVAKKLLQTFAAAIGGYLAAKAFTWIPVAGNFINASITFAITEAIGWTIFRLYSSGKTLEDAAPADLESAKNKAQDDAVSFGEYKKRLDKLPDGVRRQYYGIGPAIDD